MMRHSCRIIGDTMVPFRHISLRLSCFSVWCFPHLGCMTSRRRPTAIPPCTPCLRCHRLESTIRTVMLSVVHFSLSGFQKCWCGTIATMFSQTSGRDSQELPCCFPSFLHLLECDDSCMLSVPSSTSDLHNCRWQSGKICQVLSTGAFTLFCHVFMVSMKVCSSFIFCLAHAFVCSISPVFSA